MTVSRATAGLMMMIMAPPPSREPAVVILAKYIGNPDDSRLAFKPLYDLHPKAVNGGPVPIQNCSDGFAFLEAKGDYKRYSIVGLHRFDRQRFLKIITV